MKVSFVIRKLMVSGYRCFKHLEIDNLSRVNLFVGQNNSGKTSLLEAIHLVANGNFGTCWSLAKRRGEIFSEESTPQRSSLLLDVRHMFTGHRMTPDSKLQIESNESFFALRKTQMTRRRHEDGQLFLTEIADSGVLHDVEDFLDLYSSLGRVPIRLKDNVVDVRSARRADSQLEQRLSAASVYLPTGRQQNQELQKRWDSIALTPKEDKVVEAARIIEPRIQRIAFVGGEHSRMRIKLEGESEPIPLGSLGDGVRRVLALSLAMVCAENGFLLVDELETGLYYRTQKTVWDFLLAASQLLNVQLFVTTHSQDCLRAFARALEDGNHDGCLIRLSRRGGDITPVRYSPEELVTTLEQEIEVR